MSDETKVPSNSLSLENFRITPVSGPLQPTGPIAARVAIAPQDPLGSLAGLRGTWRGTGFNQIWRPFHGSQDRFLELNETAEVLQFVEIPGDIPNRGFLQGDIALHGLTYLQMINDANVVQNGQPAGIHIEPGIWLTIPVTTDPQDQETVARLANIPHGTSLVAQGTAAPSNGKPTFAQASITPFTIAPPNTLIPFPETNLSNPTDFRTKPVDIPNVTQAMIDNPNVVLEAGVAQKQIKSVIQLQISTIDLNPPPSGGGTSNIAFLQGTGGGPNAQSVQVDATFWIEEFLDNQGNTKSQLQYSQRVLLNFNNLSWPHVSVATLLKD
jgi:hypothetical protein